MVRMLREKVLGSVAVVSVTVAMTLVSSPVVGSAGSTATSPATPVVRALLNRAILPPKARLVHPTKAVVCQCDVPADTKYLVTMHRFYVVPGSPASVEEFVA